MALALDSVMLMAAKTGTNEWWKLGLGGMVWDSIVNDPQLGAHLAWVLGNCGPDAQLHGSLARGDNLFLCSIVALDAKTAFYRWHYREVLEEDRDYTCTPSIL